MLNDKMELQLKILTIPFNEYNFYKNDIIEKLFRGEYENSEGREKYFRDLLRIIYPIVTRNNRVNNLDEVKLLSKKYYFYNSDLIQNNIAQKNHSLFYLDLLSEISRLFVTHRNGKIALKYWESKEEDVLLGPYKGVYKVALWNSLNRIFTTDILVVLYLINNGMTEEYYLKGYHSHVSLEDIELNQILQKGIGETHMHFSAGGHFTLNWQTLMSPTRKHISKSVQDESLYTNQLMGTNFNLYKYILVMASVRLLLGNYLQNIEGNKSLRDIDLFSFYKHFKDIKINKHEKVKILQFLESIATGDELIKESEYYFYLYEGVKDILNIEIKTPLKNSNWNTYLAIKDILHKTINSFGEYTTVENVFLFKCLKYMKMVNTDDLLFHKLFWQYIRIKNEKFKLEIQKNSIKGLEYFKPFIQRATDTVDIDDSEIGKWGMILHTVVQSSNIKKLELRITVGKGSTVNEKIHSLVKKLKAFFNAYLQLIDDFILEGKPASQIAIIIHFIKEADSSLELKCWKDKKNKKSLYFYDLQLKYEMEMKAVNNLRESVPGLSDYLVGIDAANLETNTEPWVFAPIYKGARNSDSHKLIYSSHLNKRIRNLGFTYHVGEDFRHMITGLRHIDEVIEHFQYRSGDRIGHGIVLGIPAIKWAKKHKVVTLPLHEYLDNLLWMWGLCKDNKLNIEFTRLEWKIIQLAEKIYINIEGLDIFMLWKGYRAKFNNILTLISKNEESCSQISCPLLDESYQGPWNINSIQLAQHCSFYIERLNKPIQIEIEDEEIKVIEAIQYLIKEKISKEGIVVETNPSSNIAIGELEHIFEHYIHNLNTVHPNSNNIKVTINTDDPIVFNTNISNEYAYIFYALLEKGYSREEAISWIDRIRENGLTSSFIETKDINNDYLKHEISEILKRLNEL